MTNDEHASQPRPGAGSLPDDGEGATNAQGEPVVEIPAIAPIGQSDSLDGRSRLGPARRVLFLGKSMSRTRCTGALVDSLRRHGVEVRWRNLVTWRRWFGTQIANKLARAEFRSYKPDVVFVFFRDLPLALASEFRRTARIVVWCEEALEVMDSSVIDYFRLADLVCMSNPARFPWLREHGLDNMAFLMSGFSPRYHRPVAAQQHVRDVAFIGGPGRRGQRASFLAEIARRFDTEVFGRHWDRWSGAHKHLRVNQQINNKAYAKVCATSRIVLGVNEVNDDAYYCSNRTFLTMACGAFHLTHYVPQLENVFTDGEHLVWYRDEDEAIDKIAEWLPKADERARVAAGGHAEVMQHHQYYHRVARILHWLEHGLPREDQVRLPTEALSVPAPATASRSNG
ncbi:MAG: glycosyltransferase family 1 protein [Planctomycetes bacterium]|nr:glycosyltransferase family 1 protein [Planctomycetota bacterium]